MNDYDVIIVGGRPAGSTLAAWLGKFGLRVLLLERASFPSLPAVSCPIIYASTLQILDEIGADEAEYARNTPKIKRLIQVLNRELIMPITLPKAYGRDYGYGIDRARFDEALWNTAVNYPTVTGWQNFNVSDLLWEGDKVVGVIGRGEDKAEKQITAKLVVGADGRFSLVARKTNAESRDEHIENPTSIYYAYWKNVAPYDSGSATAAAYAGEPGYGYLVVDSADNAAAVAVEGQATIFDAVKDAEAFYLDLVQRNPLVQERLQNAEQLTSVRGMKYIGNLYRQPGGKGWALVGDAYHQKDPLDGQGIFDAVFSAKALAFAIKKWLKGEFSRWDEALEWYDENVRIKTYGTYRAVLSRVQTSIYGDPLPEWMVRLAIDDPILKDFMGRVTTRQVPADLSRWVIPAITVGAMFRGSLRDLRRRIR